MISFENVTKQFGNHVAVNKVSFSANRGDIIGFVGANGAGKTTTMRLLLGYLFPSSGTITINSISPQENRVSVTKIVGYLPENNPLPQDMKVREYIEFIGSVKHASLSQIKSLIQEIGLDKVLFSKIGNLSRGFKQRVGLISALIGNPPIFILDEPTSGLDPLEQEKIRKLICRMSKQKIVLFSTHILSEVEEVANRLIIIHEGSIQYDGKKPTGKGAVEKLFKQKVRF